MSQTQTSFEDRLARLQQSQPVENSSDVAQKRPKLDANAPIGLSGSNQKKSRGPMIALCSAGLVLSIGLGLSADRIITAISPSQDIAAQAPKVQRTFAMDGEIVIQTSGEQGLVSHIEQNNIQNFMDNFDPEADQAEVMRAKQRRLQEIADKL